MARSPAASLTGSGRSNSALTKLKTAVLAPMPIASVSTTTALKPGSFNSWRKAILRSFITQRLHRIDLGCAPCWWAGSQQRDDEEENGNTDEGDRVHRVHVVELSRNESRQSKAAREAGGQAPQRQQGRATEHHRDYPNAVRAQRHSHADLVPALAH